MKEMTHCIVDVRRSKSSEDNVSLEYLGGIALVKVVQGKVGEK